MSNTVTEKRLKLYIAIAYTSIGATISALTLAWSLATRAAEHAVEPVDRELRAHIASIERDRKVMDAFATSALEKLDALCRATPNARCPLGMPVPP